MANGAATDGEMWHSQTDCHSRSSWHRIPHEMQAQGEGSSALESTTLLLMSCSRSPNPKHDANTARGLGGRVHTRLRAFDFIRIRQRAGFVMTINEEITYSPA